MKQTVLAFACLLAVILSSTAAEARHRHHHHAYHHHSYVTVHNRATGAPQGCPSAWCGCWMMRQLGLTDRRLWRAVEWRHVGSPIAGPVPGAIGVMPHHVFKVVQVVGPRYVLAVSGNDGHRVRTRIRSTNRVIAWRMP